MEIITDDLSGVAIADLLKEHLQHMQAITPPESIHALGLEALRKPEVTLWSVWEDEELIGCGALKELDRRHGEIKSMRTALSHRSKGVAKRLVQHILAEARRRGYRRLSLETGAAEAFEPARRLYEKFGFDYGGPFGDYHEDPNSTFMTKRL